jgi:hypothetical protein
MVAHNSHRMAAFHPPCRRPTLAMKTSRLPPWMGDFSYGYASLQSTLHPPAFVLACLQEEPAGLRGAKDSSGGGVLGWITIHRDDEMGKAGDSINGVVRKK